MKKILALVLCMFAAGSLLFAGASKEGGAKEKVILKIATILTSGEPAVNQMYAFADRVAKRSNGEIEIQVYPNSELYTVQKDILEAIVRGGNIIAFADPAQMADYVPDYAIMNGPYLYNSPYDIRKVGLSDWGQEQVNALAKKGIRVIDSMTTYFGTRQMISKKAFSGPGDLRGMKVRVPTTPLWVETITAMGGNPTTIAFSECYSALQQGVVDAAENPLPSIYAAKFQEVAKNVVMTQHMIAPGGLEMSEEFFQKLSKEHQTILLEEALKYAELTTEEVLASESKVIDAMKKEGVTFTDPDIAAFRKATEIVYSKFPAWTPGAYDRVKAIVAK
ncbi:MAG: C4-dicarboxylate TRAP transporter substrate-binding protein [Treponema sp.]|jgi:tripartite ATP-independent transporter DctP family solute receptor|nr:C4-dicarboxylate TRAP transporter substrate-binding protein [Treponema sp.]